MVGLFFSCFTGQTSGEPTSAGSVNSGTTAGRNEDICGSHLWFSPVVLTCVYLKVSRMDPTLQRSAGSGVCSSHVNLQVLWFQEVMNEFHQAELFHLSRCRSRCGPTNHVDLHPPTEKTRRGVTSHRCSAAGGPAEGSRVTSET